jgi:hypothetical protein
MQNILYLFIISFFIVSCSGEEEIDPADSDVLVDKEIDSIDVEESEETDGGDFEGIESKHVMFCKIGIYQEPAIMALNWSESDENGVTPITGYYYYLKHGKYLDLEGYSESRTRGIYLTESYKGEKTGYMEFAQDAHIQPWDGENYWAASKESTVHQEFYSQDILFQDPMEGNLALTNEHYYFDHEVMMFDAAEEYTMEVTNELHVSRINEEYFAFTLYVVCTNGHQGGVDGLAKIEGNKAYFDNESEDEWDVCKLTFDLSVPDEITVEEIECQAYHGARAYFDGTLYKKD